MTAVVLHEDDYLRLPLDYDQDNGGSTSHA